MKTFLRLLPAGLCSLLMAAHLLRMSLLLPALICCVLPVILGVRRRFVRGLVVALLLLGSVSWVLTTLQLVMVRQQMGSPYLRMALILGGVSAFYLVAAALLFGTRMRGYFNPRPSGDSGPPGIQSAETEPS